MARRIIFSYRLQGLVSKPDRRSESEAELRSHHRASLKTPLAAANRFLEILYKFKADLSDEQPSGAQARDALAMTVGG
jgi:hypothetical protein